MNVGSAAFYVDFSPKADPSENHVLDPDPAERATQVSRRWSPVLREKPAWVRGDAPATMDFEHLLGLHTGTRPDPLPIVDIDPRVARALGADVRRVLLSAATIRKQLVHHRELPISVYRNLAPCLLRGSYRQDGPRSAVVLFTEPGETGRHVRAYVKATQAGHELYLTSFLMMRDRDMKRELRKPYPIIRPAL